MSMKDQLDVPQPNKTDYWIALAVGMCGLAVYVRTLAPDVLYGDSAEFQTLAYTLGTTHSTGYPIYLLLGRLLGFLPIASPAWRINLLSALSAAVTLSSVFLLARYLTRSRIGAVLGSVALGLSYTFWSQVVITEVYAPALAFLGVIILLVWRWHDAPPGNDRALLFATLLTGLGLGVHASVVLIGPAIALLVALTLWARRATWAQWLRSIGMAAIGLALGIALFVLAFVLLDLHNPPSSFIQVTLYPSRSVWGLTPADLDSPFERMWLTVSGLQWRDAMFPANIDRVDEFVIYSDRLISYEFSALMLGCAIVGVIAMLHTKPRLGVFWLVAFATSLLFVLNYQPPDKYIFFLPTYLLIALALGCGAGLPLDWAYRHLVAVRKRRYLAPLYLLAVVLLVLMVVRPSAASRWQALRDGAATFVQEDYAYPIYNLEEPRQLVAWQLGEFPENALLISDWRALYTMYYLAHVERKRPDITVMEASPYGADNLVADSLIQTLEDALHEGRPVFTNRVYENLRQHFRVQPALGGRWYRLSLPGGN
jgi:hypothetical protein